MCADWLDVGTYIYLRIVVRTAAKYRLIKGLNRSGLTRTVMLAVVEHLHYFLLKTLSTELYAKFSGICSGEDKNAKIIFQ